MATLHTRAGAEARGANAAGSVTADRVPRLSTVEQHKRDRARPRAATRGFTAARLDILLLVLLTGLGILSRIYTTNSLAGEPTPDEYLYGMQARDVAQLLATHHLFPLNSLLTDGRTGSALAALLSLVSWDQVTAGRTVQALFNALAVPSTYVLARSVRAPRPAAVAGALILLAIPDFQEDAWRFWLDSQATCLGALYVAALVWCGRRRTVLSFLPALALLALLFLTKDSTSATYAPFFPLVLVGVLVAELGSRSRAALIGALAALALGAGALLFLALGPFAYDATHLPLLGRILSLALAIVPSLPSDQRDVSSYAGQVVSFITADEYSVAALVAWLVGGAWLFVTAARACRGPTRQRVRLAWWIAAVCMAPIIAAILLSGVLPIHGWVTGAAVVLVLLVIAARPPVPEHAPWPCGVALLALTIAAFGAQRFALVSTPGVGGGVAFTPRNYLPILPALCVLGGLGICSALSAFSDVRPLPRVRAALSVAAAVALVLTLSPLLGARFSATPLLGRVAVRDDDPTTPQGLRVEVMAAAQPWLESHLTNTDAIITGVPRQLGWYADLSSEAEQRLIDLGSQPRTQQERLAYMMPRVGPTGTDAVVDFNIAWTDPGSADAQAWQKTFNWLASQPNLDVAYLVRDHFGNPVFFVILNRASPYLEQSALS